MQYIFVIDALETVIYEGPQSRSAKFKKHMKLAKRKCLLYCKDPEYQYNDNLAVDRLSVDLLAKASASKLIVGVLLDIDYEDIDGLWHTIDRVIEKLDNADVEVNGINSVKAEIDKIVEQALKHNNHVALNNSSFNHDMSQYNEVSKEIKGSILSMTTTDELIGENNHKNKAWYEFFDTKLGMLAVGGGIVLIMLLFFVILNKHFK